MKLLKERFGRPAGTVVYEYHGYAYGLDREDDIAFTDLAPHVTVSEEKDKTPFFTVPKSWLGEH